MTFRPRFGVIFLLSIVVSAVISDSTWSFSDELSAPETEVLLNDEVHASNQPDLPMNLASSPQGGSGLLFGDMESSNLFSSDDDGIGRSFELADCSSSELVPAIRKSRIRRRDGSTTCENQDSTPPTASNPPFDAAQDPWGGLQGLNRQFTEFRQEEDQNSACGLMTLTLLPWGACHSGSGTSPAGFVTIGGMTVVSVFLPQCSPGTLNLKLSLS